MPCAHLCPPPTFHAPGFPHELASVAPPGGSGGWTEAFSTSQVLSGAHGKRRRRCLRSTSTLENQGRISIPPACSESSPPTQSRHSRQSHEQGFCRSLKRERRPLRPLTCPSKGKRERVEGANAVGCGCSLSPDAKKAPSSLSPAPLVRRGKARERRGRMMCLSRGSNPGAGLAPERLEGWCECTSGCC